MEEYSVLIAEDDFRVSNIWKEFTHSMPGFEVTGEARNGMDALESLSKKQTDLLIMDVYMPDMDGVQLLYEIRSQRISTDVIVITAAKESKIVQRIMRLGVLDYIIKPCVLERYQLSLNRFMKLRKSFGKEELEQAELDELIHWKIIPPGESRKLPKGMQEITMERVMNCFDQNPFARGAEEITRSTGLSLATVQRYLRYLAEINLIKKELTYGSQGRPEHKYTKS
jgi:two-component system, CitB family, response regulator